MKKLFCTLCICALLVGLLGSMPVMAAGSMTTSASASSVTVGSTVTITVKYNSGGPGIGGLQSTITYNADVFDYVSCTGIEGNGGAGTLLLVWHATGSTAPSSVEYKITLKAKAPGDGKVNVATTEFVDDNTFASLGTPSKSLTVSCINPTKSGNADLKYLRPSAGTLTPAFSPNVTAYTITVPYTVTSVLLTTDSVDQNASVEVNGSSSMKVGKNVRSVTVTAPNGTTKTYTITITRSEDQSTTTSNNSGGTTTTTTTPPTPDEDPLEVSVDGNLMNVADAQPAIDLPAGFAWEPMELGGVMVPAAKNKDNNLTLLYLLGAKEEDHALYIYGEDGLFTLFRPLTVNTTLYTLLPAPEALETPANTVIGEVMVGDTAVEAYVYEDTALEDFALVYAVGPTGYVGWHTYDKADGSIQRYRELGDAVIQKPATEPEETKPTTNGFVQFVTDYRSIILVCAAACGGLALLIGAVVLVLILTHRGGKARH